MDYTDVELDLQWWPGNFSLLRYPPVRRANKSTYLILDFKESKPLALEKVRHLAIQAFREIEGDLSRYTYRYLVALPRSKQDDLNGPCEYICSALAAKFSGLVHLKGALQRVVTVTKSATASPGERPNYDTHLSTIEYVGPSPLHPNSVIIMVDDVYTRGETSRACRDILRAATHCKDVLGCFIGRTI
jgi:predicted amidophosphoribosyltransferase